MMIFHRLRKHRHTSETYPSEGPVLAVDSEKKDMSRLYPIPDKCFITTVGEHDTPVSVTSMARGTGQRR